MGKKVSFDKVIAMMDDMVELLKQEQKDDEKQKEWCENEFETSEDKDAELKRKLEGLEASIEEMTAGIAKLADEIKALEDGIVALDKSVAEATETRKEEHAEFVTVSAQNNAAVQLLGVAENRLNKFYNPTVYKAPERRELTEEERIYVNSGGVDPPTLRRRPPRRPASPGPVSRCWRRTVSRPRRRPLRAPTRRRTLVARRP